MTTKRLEFGFGPLLAGPPILIDVFAELFARPNLRRAARDSAGLRKRDWVLRWTARVRLK
jgi:hypothetical protein